VIPLLKELVKPSLDTAKNLVTALNWFAVSCKGTTNRKGCQNNAVIMNFKSNKLLHLKNGRHKKTDLIIGVLSPLLSEPQNP
jgi:hypothetical protein